MKTHLIVVVLLGVALALVGVLAGEGRADFILYGSETLTVNTIYENGYLWDTSHASVVFGGQVSALYAYNNSSVGDLTGGYVYSLQAHDYSTVNVSGGTLARANTYDSSTFEMSDGATFLLYTWNTGAADISGGSVDNLGANNSSTVNISGGSVSILFVYDSSTVTFYGQNFRLGGGLTWDGERVLGTGSLSGEWMDGTRWGVNIQSNDPSATILASPEPATLSLLALGGLMLLRRVSPALRWGFPQKEG